jgi:hypothetical protein
VKVDVTAESTWKRLDIISIPSNQMWFNDPTYSNPVPQAYVRIVEISATPKTKEVFEKDNKDDKTVPDVLATYTDVFVMDSTCMVG